MKLNYLIAILILILFSICLVNALEGGTPLVCGGSEDGETIIMCLGDEELIFLGYDVPPEVPGGSYEGEGAEETHTLPTPTPIPTIEPFMLFAIIDLSFLRGIGLEPEDLWLIYGILIIFILSLFLYFRKRKCDKCRKRFRYKDLTKHKGKYYCEDCLEKIKPEGKIEIKKVKKKKEINLINIVIVSAILILLLIVFIYPPTEEENIETGITIHYYKDGVEIFPEKRGFTIMTPPGEEVDQISLEINATNIGNVPITNVQVISASPQEFLDSLSSAIPQTLSIGETKTLWISDLINTTDLEPPNYDQPITFWINVSGYDAINDITYYVEGFSDPINFIPEEAPLIVDALEGYGTFNTTTEFNGWTATIDIGDGDFSYDTNGFIEGTLKGSTIIGRRKQFKGYMHRTTLSIDANSETILDFVWKWDYSILHTSTNDLQIDLVKPDMSVVTVWSSHYLDPWSVWIPESIDITDYIDQTGIYEIRLGCILNNGNDKNAQTSCFFDEVFLYSSNLNIIDCYLTPGDGDIWINSDQGWDVAHDATSGYAAYLSSPYEVRVSQNTYAAIQRVFIPIDTSNCDIPVGANIQSADLHFCAIGEIYNGDNDENAYFAIVPTSQADATGQVLQDEDFDQIGTTEYSDKLFISDIVGEEWEKCENYFVLNAQGLEALDFQGITLFGIREGHDIMDNPIDHDAINSMYIMGFESTGEPYLRIKYT